MNFLHVFCIIYYAVLLSFNFHLTSELSGDEYKAAKVDPIAQFSKPVAVVISN